jgi:hypothetical protein
MIHRVLKLFGKARSDRSSEVNVDALHTGHLTEIYELLFCDNPDLFRPGVGIAAAPWQEALYNQADSAAVRAIAENRDEDSRVRLLAYRWLMARGEPPCSSEILGVVIEVGLERGNDTLAAYSDGSVRYINQSGKLAVFEGGPPAIVAQVGVLISASEATVARIGPWTQTRRAPPGKGDVRLSFLVADGLYFGEGPFHLLQNEPLARPVINAGTRLLELCVHAAET